MSLCGDMSVHSAKTFYTRSPVSVGLPEQIACRNTNSKHLLTSLTGLGTYTGRLLWMLCQ